MPKPYTTLIDADALGKLVEQGGVVIIDCRFSLADTAAGRTAYNHGHIPGAFYADLDHDLSSAIVEGTSGRHPLPEAAQFIARLRNWGVNNETQVIVYDDAGGAIAARAWWLCRWVGHERCAVLNGGINAWTDQLLPLSVESPGPQAGSVNLKDSLVKLVQAADLPDSTVQLIDARAAQRYRGEHEPLDKRAGHIPGAINLPFTDNLDSDGKFLTTDLLRDRFSALQQAGKPAATIHYCGSGVTAAHNLLAMQHAGLEGGGLYAGSWSEWVQDETRPVATGDQ